MKEIRQIALVSVCAVCLWTLGQDANEIDAKVRQAAERLKNESFNVRQEGRAVLRSIADTVGPSCEECLSAVFQKSDYPEVRYAFQQALHRVRAMREDQELFRVLDEFGFHPSRGRFGRVTTVRVHNNVKYGFLESQSAKDVVLRRCWKADRFMFEPTANFGEDELRTQFQDVNFAEFVSTLASELNEGVCEASDLQPIHTSGADPFVGVLFVARDAAARGWYGASRNLMSAVLPLSYEFGDRASIEDRRSYLRIKLLTAIFDDVIEQMGEDKAAAFETVRTWDGLFKTVAHEQFFIARQPLMAELLRKAEPAFDMNLVDSSVRAANLALFALLVQNESGCDELIALISAQSSAVPHESGLLASFRNRWEEYLKWRAISRDVKWSL